VVSGKGIVFQEIVKVRNYDLYWHWKLAGNGPDFHYNHLLSFMFFCDYVVHLLLCLSQ
jgi:hypothetical protein